MSPVVPKILIIDDDVAVTETFSRLLELEGHDVRATHSAEAGLREVQLNPPDAVIVDLRMPLVNGLGFLYRLRALEPHQSTPVAIVTADYCLDEDVVRELTDLGAVLHFKPLWLEDLLTLTQSLLAMNPRVRPDRAAHN
jgi:DNA-binding response OmpR family regulator